MSEITVEMLLDQVELLPAVEQKRFFAALAQKLNGGAKPVEKIKNLSLNLISTLCFQQFSEV